MRVLSNDEATTVVGAALEEVVSLGKRFPIDPFNAPGGTRAFTFDFFGSMPMVGGGDGGGGGEVLDEVVVEAARDYCGNKYFDAPDIVRESCKQHDKDYSKDSELSRKEADDRFLENMKKELAEKYPDMPEWARNLTANFYYKAVRENGHVSYQGKGENDRVVKEGDDIPRIPRF